MEPESQSNIAPAPGRARRITQNAFFLSGSEIFSRFFTWVIVVYLFRHWSLASYGQYAIVVNWITIFSVFSGMGLGSLAIREVAHNKDLSNYYLRNITAIRFGISIVFILALSAIGPLLNYESSLRLALVIMGLRLLFDAPVGAYTALLQAHELMNYQGLVACILAFLRMAGILLAVHFGGCLISVSWVGTGVGFFSLLMLWRLGSSRNWKFEWIQFRWTEALVTLKKSIPFAAFGTFQILYYRVDGIILKSFSGNEAVALYDAAGKFLFVVFMIADHFSISILPTFSASRERPKDLARIAVRSLKVLVLLGAPITVGGFLLAGPLMVLLFGPKCVAAGPIFAVLALSVFFYFATKPFINLLVVKNPSRLTYLFLGLFIANVALNFILIPRYGLMGAAVISTSCEVILLVSAWWLASGYLSILNPAFYRAIVSSFLAACIMGVGIYFDPRLYWLALGPLVYGAVLYLTGGIDKDDVASFKSILRISP
jgi:O-antigen/teichoic acid export membrane protein